MVLEEMKRMAEKRLGVGNITKTIVTVPAYFNSAQKQATRDACTIAGLECMRIINEPTAAVLAYHRGQNETDRIILVYDFGGGTLDVSLVALTEGCIDVLGTQGDSYLGGRDFDEALIQHCIKAFRQKYNIDLRNDKSAYQRLREKCELAKIELTTED